jgi:hypothetical protein
MPVPADGRSWRRRWLDAILGADIRIVRHHGLSTALPFPPISWSANVEQNLAELHDYAVQLAHGALDWYLKKRRWKKLWSKTLHIAAYTAATLAALVQLIKVLSPAIVDRILGGLVSVTNRNPSEFAAEATLVLIGIAGGFSLIDKLAGFTAAWMRYMLTATRINRALIAFHFDWTELERSAPVPPSPPMPPPPPPVPRDECADTGSPPRCPDCCKCCEPKTKDPVTARIELIKEFCLKILETMDGETESWADELKKTASQLASTPIGHTGRG